MSMQIFRQFNRNRIVICTQLLRYSTNEIPKNNLEKVHTAHLQPENGVIYDKKPFKMVLEAGKKYSWCSCGKSKSQPLCDGTHKNTFLKIKLKPVKIEVSETKEYYLCNCKQSSHKPFCDGTHKQEFVQQTAK